MILDVALFQAIEERPQNQNIFGHIFLAAEPGTGHFPLFFCLVVLFVYIFWVTCYLCHEMHHTNHVHSYPLGWYFVPVLTLVTFSKIFLWSNIRRIYFMTLIGKISTVNHNYFGLYFPYFIGITLTNCGSESNSVKWEIKQIVMKICCEIFLWLITSTIF